MITDRTRKALERVGMTGYEIRAFSVLLSSKGLSASETSQKSGVPYSKIYDTLGSLEEKGWISSDDSRPTTYRARSPATGLESTKQRLDGEFVRNRDVILAELVPLYEGSGTSERPDILVLSGTINIASKILEMVDGCRNEVLVALPEASKELVRQALPKLRLLHDRGVKITILTSDKTDGESLRAASRVATVKIREGLFGGGIISDQRYVVILLGVDDGGAESVAIWADHAGLAGFAKAYFEYLLQDSVKYG